MINSPDRLNPFQDELCGCRCGGGKRLQLRPAVQAKAIVLRTNWRFPGVVKGQEGDIFERELQRELYKMRQCRTSFSCSM
ncbi:hypothetical protein AMELA_G00261220 [Ameiurus melas]|uniref:Uncharacterized protein n=1 Tax=Ameiurus melas TaxID=219545 RepID=A0A7J5ZP64_AMEME|nr:hypothetical protein AMELA_G00261220 [Ameiurus melas]